MSLIGSEAIESSKLPKMPIILSGWISVEDRDPDNGQYVIMIDKFDEIPYSGQFKDGYFIDPKMSIWDDNMHHPDFWLPFTVKMPEK